MTAQQIENKRIDKVAFLRERAKTERHFLECTVEEYVEMFIDSYFEFEQREVKEESDYSELFEGLMACNREIEDL